MIVSPTLLLIIVVFTSQYIDGYPLMLSKDLKNHLTNRPLKHNFGHLQRYDIANLYNHDGILSNFDKNLLHMYSIIPRQNRKRLIDF